MAKRKAERDSGRRKLRDTPSLKHGFYAESLSEAERILLPEAREIEGLDEEIALLRVRLNSALSEHPENMTLLLKGMELLVKAVSTKYRLSKKAEKNLYESVIGVLRGIGGALWPEGFVST